MKKWQDLAKLIWAKIRNPVLDAAEKAIKKAKEKRGEIVIGSAAFIVMVVVLPFVGWVSRGGLYTRSNIVTVSIEQKNATNCTNIVKVSGQRLEVSGSGGVSVPLTGGGK